MNRQKPLKIVIAALAHNRVIGVNDRLPWRVPEEYRQFLDFITGQTVIWGRKTFEIFGKRPPSKRNIVVSFEPKSYDAAETVLSIEEALQRAEQFPETIFIAGGAAIYEQTLPLADKMYLSFIEGDYDGDTFFPEFDENDWEIEERRQQPRFTFVIYARKS